MQALSKSSLDIPHWPWSKMDLQEVAQQALDSRLYLPGFGYLAIETKTKEWHAELGAAANSKRLWINSLVSIHASLELIVRNSVEQEQLLWFSAEFLKRYFAQYRSNRGIFEGAWQDEHAVANRLFVLTAFIHYGTRVEAISRTVERCGLLQEAYEHAEWLVDSRHYVKNNHGVMMDLALAQFATLIRPIAEARYQKYITICMSRLKAMLSMTFDESGLCTENSPTYHFVNYALFTTIFRFLTRHSLNDDVETWERTLAKAKAAGNLLLRADGSIPTVGDSEASPNIWFPQSRAPGDINGIGYYPTAGFFIASVDHLHLTFRAGGASFSHRHVDDLSLTLHYSGREFVVDCGMYNYDITDRKRRWYLSSLAHSGVYLESMGDVRFSRFSSPRDMSRFEGFSGDGSSFEVSATHNLSVEAEVIRKICFSENQLTITDCFESKLAQRFRIQFHLHPDVKASPGDNAGEWLLTSGGVTIQFIAEPGVQLALETSRYSATCMEEQHTQALVIEGVSESLTTSVRLILN